MTNSPIRRRLWLAVAVLALLAAPASAQKKKLTIEDLTAEPPLAGRAVAGLTWLPGSDNFSYLVRTGAGEDSAAELILENAGTGKKTTVASPETLALPEDAKPADSASGAERRRPRRASLDGYRWAPDGKTLVLSGGDDLWLYHADERKLERLTHEAGTEEFPQFSPDGKLLAFTRKNDLYVLDLASRKEKRLTTDGTEHVFNGRLDWVYEEELASRTGRGYEWSPDSSAIAYLRLDETRVDSYPLGGLPEGPGRAEGAALSQGGIAQLGRLLPRRRSGRVAARGGEAGGGHLHRARVLVDGGFQIRLLPGLEPRAGQPGSAPPLGARRRVEDPLRREGPVLDQRRGSSEVPQGRALRLEVRAGRIRAHLRRQHLRRRARAITSGQWMVDRIVGVDESRNLVYFTANEENVRRRSLYRVLLDGSRFTRYPLAAGTHVPEVSPDGLYVLDTFSTTTAPPIVSLLDFLGRPLRAVYRPDNRLSEYELAASEEVEVSADDGTKLMARLVKPANFDPSKKYPVVVYVYGGPHSQVVRDAWGAASLFDHYLASKGFLLWSLDNRGSLGAATPGSRRSSRRWGRWSSPTSSPE